MTRNAWFVVMLVAFRAAGQETTPPAVTLAQRLTLCATCHTADGNSTIPDNPVLAGQTKTYLLQQLKDFKSGTRKSAVMSGVITAVDEGEFKGLADHFSSQTPKPAAAKVDARLAAKGKAIFADGLEAAAVPACSGCHNDDGSGSGRFPRLAGQHPTYVLRQLQNYKSGERANDAREVMREVTQRMTEAQMRAVAAYVATLRGDGE